MVTKFYKPELDVLRFFAFLLVFIHHHDFFETIPFLKVLNKKGWIGVDVFFTLSSFLISSLLIKEFNSNNKINIPYFFRRRILRILPLYYFLVLISFVVYLIQNEFTNLNLWRLFSLLTVSDNIFSSFCGYNKLPFISHLWTISYEEQFYLLIPFLFLLVIKNNKNKVIKFAFLIFIVLSLIRLTLIYYKVPHPAIWVLPITHFESILFGLFFAFLYHFNSIKVNKYITLLIICITFYIVSILPNTSVINYKLMILYPTVGLFSISVLYLFLNFKNKFFENKILVYLGKRSYGLYVFHTLANTISYVITDNLLYSVLISFPLTIILAVLSYRFIETPFLKLKSKFEIINSRPA